MLARFGFNPSELIAATGKGSGKGQAFLAPGGQYKSPIDLISLGIGVSLAFIGLPHVFQHFYTVRDDQAAESSAIWLLGIEAVFTVMVVLILGLGATALLGTAAIAASDRGGNTAALLLAQKLGGGAGSVGGDVFLAIFGAVAFATVLAVVAGLMVAATTTFAHDLYANVSRSETRFRAVSWCFAAGSASRLGPSRGAVVARLPVGEVPVRAAGGVGPV
ncbi:MAG: sodium:solute symporter family transporter [Actinoallomurus sp.]